MNNSKHDKHQHKDDIRNKINTSNGANTSSQIKEKCKDVKILVASTNYPPSVDVIILTALRIELCAILSLGDIIRSNDKSDFENKNKPDNELIPSIDYWTEYKDTTDYPYYLREFVHSTGLTFRVAAAECQSMGLASATWRATSLVKELRPRCLAMSGICAGKKGSVNLGDVIVADKVYQYDYGKLKASNKHSNFSSHEIFHDITTYNLDTRWRDHVLDFFPESETIKIIGKDRPYSRTEQINNLLIDILKNGPKDIEKCKNDSQKYKLWHSIVTELINNDLLEITSNRNLDLTYKGKIKAIKINVLNPNNNKHKFRVHMGAIGTGNQVVQDPKIFTKIQRHGRTTLGIEMEALSIGLVASTERVPYMLIAKGVSDFADYKKDDSLQEFASIASAKFLLYFLQKYLPPKRSEIFVSQDATTSRINRTKRIIYALLEANTRANIIIRQVATFSSLAIDDNEAHEPKEYFELLKRERDLMESLLNNGCTIRCIIRPKEWEKPIDVTSSECDKMKKNWQLRLNKLKNILTYKNNSKQSKWKLEMVYSDALPKHNLLIIGENILFEGRKLDSASGFPCTMVSTQKDRLAFEIKYFDQLFESSLSGYTKLKNRKKCTQESKSKLLNDIESILENSQ